jgi:predicted component of type VI protein secretion system
MRQFFCLFFAVLIFSSCEKQVGSADVSNDAVSEIRVSSPSQPDEDKNDVISQKIIKEAYLKFETDDLESTYNQIKTAITANKASVQSDSQEKDYRTITRRLTIRIPSQNFDAFLESISKGVSYFDEKNISSQNVTEEYIDLTSRLNTKRKLEERYIEILKKATKVSEILEIEKQISAIREEIEAKQGQLKYLESRVSESTVTIEFYKTIAQKEGVKISYGSKIWNSIQSGFFSLSDFLLSLISVWPFIILICVLAYFIRKRFKRKKI